MKGYTCFVLFRIFAYTNSLSRIKGDYTGVNLPQITAPEYSNEESSGDTNNLETIHNFETRATTLSNSNMKLDFRAPRVETLTDFIQEAVHILNTYSDTAFEDFFHILDNEIRKYHYRGCKFSELTQNSNTRGLLARSLKLIRGKSVSFTKANINEVADMMRDERYDKNVKELLDYINSLYKNTKLNFHSVLNELKYYWKMKSMKAHNNLVQVIRSGVRAILFDHYTKLNTNTRKELKERIETFWKQFKNIPESSSEINDIPYTDPVIKSVVNSIKALKNPEAYSKNDPDKKFKNKRQGIVSIDTFEISNESEKQITNYNTDELSSGQSFDSSSNSIKTSQERHEEHNTQRYMTLYTEEISYKAKATKKTEMIPISANVMTRRHKVKKRSTTTSTPRKRVLYSDKTEKIKMLRANHDTDDTKLDMYNSSSDTEDGLTLESKHVPRTRENYDKQQKHGRAYKSMSKSKHKNAQIISQYDAVIDVQLDNTDLLKSLGMLEPLEMNTNSRYDTTLHPKKTQTEPVPKKSTIGPRSMRTQAQIEPQKPTAATDSSSRYLKSYENFYRKQFADSKRSIVPNEGPSVEQYKKDKNQKHKFIARRSNSDIIGVKDFNKYIIKRINAIEKEINELKQMNDFSFRNRMNDNNTDEVDLSNVTDKYTAKDNDGSKRKDIKGNVIERLLNENRDLNNEEVNDGHTTRSNTMNTESTTTNNTTSYEPNVTKKDAVNATVIGNKNTSQVTNNNVNETNSHTKDIIKEVITNNATSTANSANTEKLKSFVTTITRRTMAYSEPSYYDYPVPPEGKSRGQLDPFGLDSDGFVLDM